MSLHICVEEKRNKCLNGNIGVSNHFIIQTGNIVEVTVIENGIILIDVVTNSFLLSGRFRGDLSRQSICIKVEY